ncbi:MAG: PAS domain S-box protein [Planctomycetota bacterium]
MKVDKKNGETPVRIAGVRCGSQSTLARIPEENPYPVFRVRPDGTLIYANTSSAPVLAEWQCGVGGQVPEPWRRLAGEAFASGTMTSPDCAAGGRIFSFVIAPVPEAGYVNFYGSDITKRKLAEEALRRQAVLIDLSADGIIVRSPEGTIRFWSEGATALYGWPANEAMGQTTDALLRTQFPQPFEAIMAVLGRSGVWSGDLVHRTRDGRQVTVQSHWVARRDAQGKLVEILESNVDVTRRKQAEEALRESGERLAGIIHSAMDGIITVDESQRVVLFNPAAEKMFRCPAAAALGAPLGRFIPERFRQAHEGHVRRFGETGETTRRMGTLGQVCGLRADGEEFPCEAAISQVLVGGQRLFTVVLRDITERQKAEEERRQLEGRALHAQKLESLGVLAGGIAHDFNNILQAILGNTELAAYQLASSSPARPYLQNMESACRRAAGLCQQMLAYSGKGRFVVEALGLNDVVRDMTHILEVAISKKAVLKYNLADNLPAIEADANQVRQVFMNLITNASEALGEANGVIAVTTGALEVEQAYLAETYVAENLPAGLYVYAEVADSGCGMKPEVKQRMFEPFFTTKFTGRGLGMAAVLGIMRGHRGAIKVYSEPGKGTAIKVLFPASKKAAAGQERAENEALWRGSGMVLVVDDEPAILATATAMLQLLGFQVLTASDGRKALEVYRAHPGGIACVLLDLTMPNLDGEETFRELRRMDPNAHVIITSGYNEQEVTQRFAGKGAAGFIQKPYQMATLRAKLRAALEARG